MSKSSTRIYNIWRCMKSRCYGKNNTAYHRYGGRGIKVCDEWRDNSDVFIKWAYENGYADDLTIDRIDSNGNYEPNNCRWVTKSQNSKYAMLDKYPLELRAELKARRKAEYEDDKERRRQARIERARYNKSIIEYNKKMREKRKSPEYPVVIALNRIAMDRQMGIPLKDKLFNSLYMACKNMVKRFDEIDGAC